MPEHPTAASFEALLVRGLDKTCNRGVIRPEVKKKGSSEFSFPRALGIAGRQSGIVGDLARAHMMEPGDAHAAFLGDLIERSADFRIRLALRDAQVAAVARGIRNLHVEITVWKEYPSPPFGDKRMAVSELASQRLDLRPCARRYQDQRDVTALISS